jgi:hypothetical protein
MNQVNVVAPIVLFVVGAVLASAWRLWVLSDSLEN